MLLQRPWQFVRARQAVCKRSKGEAVTREEGRTERDRDKQARLSSGGRRLEDASSEYERLESVRLRIGEIKPPSASFASDLS